MKNFIHTEPESDKRHLQFFPYAYYNLLIHYQEERVEKSDEVILRREGVTGLYVFIPIDYPP